MKFLPQENFPFLKEFKEKFKIDEQTIFVYQDDIFSNYHIPEDILIHEKIHIKQQEKIGADNWIKQYLADDNFRLNQELEAYRAQINFFKEREQRNKSKILCAKALSSAQYGNILNYEQAFRLLI